jgi:signal transduction histidine kinase
VVVLRLQRRIAAPILALADRARQVAAQQDLSLRVTRRPRVAELDTLIDALNTMLAGIEAREGRIRAQAAALGEANEKLRRLAMDLSLMEQSEKSRLAALLHDSPMQKLALAQMQLESGLHEPDAEGRQLIEAGLGLLREASAELRTLQFELSPPILEQEGLPAALAWLAERMGERGDLPIECRLPAADAADRPPLSPALSVTLFQCARELVYNMIKHAYASRGSIALDIDAESVCLSVADDGRGFRAPAASTPTDDGNGVRGGFGLYSIRERVHLLHGDMHIDTAPSGSRVSIRLPLAETGTTAP